MKGILKIIFGLLIIFCFTKNVKAGGLDKGFEALNIHDYFKAKQLFYKSLKKDSAAASYGLSVIYGRNNNPLNRPAFILRADGIRGCPVVNWSHFLIMVVKP